MRNVKHVFGMSILLFMYPAAYLYSVFTSDGVKELRYLRRVIKLYREA